MLSGKTSQHALYREVRRAHSHLLYNTKQPNKRPPRVNIQEPRTLRILLCALTARGEVEEPQRRQLPPPLAFSIRRAGHRLEGLVARDENLKGLIILSAALTKNNAGRGYAGSHVGTNHALLAALAARTSGRRRGPHRAVMRAQDAAPPRLE